MQRRRFLGTVAGTLALLNARPSGAALRSTLSEEFLRAVRAGDLVRVRAMLATDASLVYARDATGRSAYVLAHLHGHIDVAGLLAEQGFLMDAVEATLARNWDRVDEIGTTSPGAFNADHPIGGTAMYAAALSGLGRDLWRIQQYGADPNANHIGEDGVTPVRAGVDFADPVLALETTATLLGNGGDATRTQRAGSSVLHGAAATGNLDLIRLVVRKGGDPTVRDDAGRTPEQVAGSLGHEVAARLLRHHVGIVRDHRTSRFAYLADGSVFEQPDLTGYDPKLINRMVGVSHFELESAREITDRFPRLAGAVSYLDEAAVEAAAHTGRREVVALLLERGASCSLPTAVTMGDSDGVRRLLREDPLRVNERGAHDFPVLWYPAIGGGSVALAGILLEHGADIEQEHLGTTALHYAVRTGRHELTAFLLEKGANPDAIGRKFRTSGETPLDHAMARDDLALVRLLEAAGATQRRVRVP